MRSLPPEPTSMTLRRRSAVVGLIVVLLAVATGCDSSTDPEPTPRLLLTTDASEYVVGDVGTLTVVNQDTVAIRHRALWCAPVERLDGDDWEPLGRVFETWSEDRDPPPEPCGFLTQGYTNLEPGEELTEVFDVLDFMAVEGTYRISITETEEERVFMTDEFTVTEAEEPGLRSGG